MCIVIDKTLLELISLLVTGIGLFAIFTRYSFPGLNDPELRMMFMGSNPFLLKRDQIESTMTQIYTIVAISGFAIQGIAIVFQEVIIERHYGTLHYAAFFILCTLMSWPLTKALAVLSGKFARHRWLPEVVANQRGIYDSIKDVLDNDGLRLEETLYAKSKSAAEIQSSKDRNLRHVETHLKQLEKLLEVTDHKGSNHKSRFDLITGTFEKYIKR